MAKCCICGRLIERRYWVCKTCKKRFALAERFEGWPDWVKALADCEHQERRYQQAEAQQRLEPLGASEEVLRPYQSPLITRDDCCDGLPLSPYQTAAENSEYHRSHDLPDPPAP